MTAALYNSILSNLPAGDKKEELRKLCKSYPYFAAAHFTLLKENEEGSPLWKEEGQRAALLISPFLLKQKDTALSKSESIKVSEDIVPQASETGLRNNETSAEPHIADIAIPVNGTVQEDQSVAETIAPTDSKSLQPGKINDVPLIFEPLHTSDYFASQGIKISYDANPNDKLGRQLKSFTGWLQTMKQVHPSKSTCSAIIMDKKVEALAEISNVEGEVVTEAMAEAYLHQGKMIKAKEIYDKLSLLNPTKSSYFAAKINELQ